MITTQNIKGLKMEFYNREQYTNHHLLWKYQEKSLQKAGSKL